MKRFSTVIVAVLIFCLVMSNLYLVVCQTDVVPEKIRQATDATSSAFAELYKAENYGANITELIDRLNKAADLLTEAENAHNSGDDQLASEYALSVISITKQAIIDARDAQKTALIQSKSNICYSVVFAIIGCSSVIFVLFLCWRLVKNHYIANMLNSTPEVKDH